MLSLPLCVGMTTLSGKDLGLHEPSLSSAVRGGAQRDSAFRSPSEERGHPGRDPRHGEAILELLPTGTGALLRFDRIGEDIGDGGRKLDRVTHGS